MVPFLVLLIMVPFIPARADLGYVTYEEIVTADGYVTKNGGVYTDFNTNDLYAQLDGVVIYRTWMRWDVSSIPDTAYVTKITFKYDATAATPGALAVLTNFTSDPVGLTAQQRYDGVASGNTLYTSTGTWATGDNQEVVIAQEYDVDCQGFMTALSGGQDWFALGFKLTNEAAVSIIRLEASNNAAAAPKPTLYIEYFTATPYQFGLNNPIYENNTDAGAVSVTAHTINGTDTFSMNNDVTKFYSMMPEAFSWPVYSATRYIHVFEDENFTVTVPYDTIGVYAMDVKDKTTTGGSATAYLEVYRSIGGAELLVERMNIIPGNPTPVNLMVGSVYHIKVIFADGTAYDWGYFTATSVTGVNIIIRLVEFSDGAQILFGTIHVDGTRSGATITVDYLDDQNNTVWSNVTIRERNGPVVLTVPYSNGSYTMNWASANTSLAYTVTVAGQHTYFGAWGRSWSFDPTYTFPAFPSLTGIYGSASGDLLPFLIVAVVTLLFSFKWQARGLLAGVLMASFLSLFGAASWSYYWLAFAWFIAIMVNINTGGES